MLLSEAQQLTPTSKSSMHIGLFFNSEHTLSNPICTHNLTITCEYTIACIQLTSHIFTAVVNGTSVTASIVDLFPGGPEFNVGLSPSAFEKFASLQQGIVNNVAWHINP
jgi:hypothetical protein